MSRIIRVRAASCLQQFVGYWGYDNPTKLVLQFKMLLSQIVQKNWCLSPETPLNGTLVELSAGGSRQNPSDAWVRIGENCLTLGRDTFGRIPIYWLQIEEVIWFASQLKLLLPLLESPQVSIAGLYGYSCLSYVPTPITPVENIVAVPAGREQTWRLDDSGSILAPQSENLLEWCQEEEQIENEHSAITQLQTLLKEAVEKQSAHLHDQTVGVFLSGGLDSSIIAALLVQSGLKVRAYTLDFGKNSIPEYPYAQQVAQWLNIPLVKVDATPRRIQRALMPTIRALDLPFGDGVTVPLFLLNQAASQETGTIFNGEGGDQLFGGWTNKPLIAASIYQKEHLKCQESFEDKYLQTFHRLWGYEAQVFQPTVYSQIKHFSPEKWLEPALDSSSTGLLLHRLRRATLMLKGAQNIHPRATNLAFAHNLQVGSPFCDVSLAQWTFRLSGKLFLQGACEKYILKKAVEPWLPPEIVWRQKRGMGVPLTAWCLNEWWYLLGTWLNPSILQAEGRWQSNLAERIALGELGGGIQGRRIGEILWLLIVWQLWRSQVLGEPIPNGSWNHPFWLPHQFWRYSKQWI